jgi:hypothetical protein
VPLLAAVVVAGADVVVAWSVVVVLAGLGFLGLRVSARRLNSAELICMPTGACWPLSSALTLGKTTTEATTKASMPSAKLGLRRMRRKRWRALR